MYIDIDTPVWRISVSKDGDWVGQVGVRASEYLGGDVDENCFAVYSVVMKGSFRDSKEQRWVIVRI